MHALDVLKYGHLTLMRALEGLPAEAWELRGVVGVWSVRDVVAHLASYEQALAELFGSLTDPGRPTPTLDGLRGHERFNDEQVALRQGRSPAEVLHEYEDWHAQAMGLARWVPLETYRQAGLLDWYGAEYDLEDFLVYTYYGHKREHSAQIALFKKRHLQGVEGQGARVDSR